MRLIPVAGEGRDGHADDDGGCDGRQAAAERTGGWRGERSEGACLEVAELAAADPDDVVGGHHPAAKLMRAAGLVRTAPGADARSKVVTLTAKARRLVGRLAAEWRATEAALADLEAEIPYPLSQVVTDIAEALERRSFNDRIAGKLAADPAWTESQAR